MTEEFNRRPLNVQNQQELQQHNIKLTQRHIIVGRNSHENTRTKIHNRKQQIQISKMNTATITRSKYEERINRNTITTGKHN
jgi:hypothetical protein